MHVMYFDHIYLHISASRSSQICHHSLSTQFPLLFYTIQYQLMLPSDFRAWGKPPQCSWLTWAFILKQNGLFLSQKPYMVAHPAVGLTPAFHTRIYPGWIACRQPQLLWVHNALILFSPADTVSLQASISQAITVFSCPFQRQSLSLREGDGIQMSHRPRCGWALHKCFFSALWPAVGTRVKNWSL